MRYHNKVEEETIKALAMAKASVEALTIKLASIRSAAKRNKLPPVHDEIFLLLLEEDPNMSLPVMRTKLAKAGHIAKDSTITTTRAEGRRMLRLARGMSMLALEDCLRRLD